MILSESCDDFICERVELKGSSSRVSHRIVSQDFHRPVPICVRAKNTTATEAFKKLAASPRDSAK